MHNPRQFLILHHRAHLILHLLLFLSFSLFNSKRPSALLQAHLLFPRRRHLILFYNWRWLLSLSSKNRSKGDELARLPSLVSSQGRLRVQLADHEQRRGLWDWGDGLASGHWVTREEVSWGVVIVLCFSFAKCEQSCWVESSVERGASEVGSFCSH